MIGTSFSQTNSGAVKRIRLGCFEVNVADIAACLNSGPAALYWWRETSSAVNSTREARIWSVNRSRTILDVDQKVESV